MNFIKRPVIRLIHALGYDIIRAGGKTSGTLFGLEKYDIRTVIDIGSNRGQFAKHASKVFPRATFLCFEPLKRPYEELKEWRDAEHPDRVHAFNLALGERDEIAGMFMTEDQDDSSSMLKVSENCVKTYQITRRQSTVPVRQVRLDGFLAQPEIKLLLQPELLIKVDVQGYEARVIRGGMRAFGSARAAILEVCADELYEGQSNFKELFSLMDSLGFSYRGNLEQGKAADGHVVYFDAVFVRE